LPNTRPYQLVGKRKANASPCEKEESECKSEGMLEKEYNVLEPDDECKRQYRYRSHTLFSHLTLTSDKKTPIAIANITTNARYGRNDVSVGMIVEVFASDVLA